MKNFKFKGNQKYLRGSDIYNFFIKKNFKDIKLEFKEKIRFQPKINLIKNKNKLKNKKCIIQYNNNGKFVKLILTESRRKITKKYDYDEKLMHKHFKLFKQSASCNFKTSFTSIDVLVALNKFYNNANVKKARWYFVKLKLTKALDEKFLKKFTIKIKKNILNKFTIMNIFKGYKKVGEIEYIAND